jgi:hypothetical protein
VGSAFYRLLAWAKDYYEQQRAKGKPRNTVLRPLAFKWIRILFRCWKDHKPYSEEVYRRFSDFVINGIQPSYRQPATGPSHRFPGAHMCHAGVSMRDPEIIETELMEISAIADDTIKFERIIAWCASHPDEVAFALHQLMSRHDQHPLQNS